MDDPDNTRPEDLLRAAEIGRQAGLRYVYAGNLPGKVGDLEDTRCRAMQRDAGAQKRLLRRGVLPDCERNCPSCRHAVPGRWPAAFDWADQLIVLSCRVAARVWLQSHPSNRMMKRSATFALLLVCVAHGLFSTRLPHAPTGRGSDRRLRRIQDAAAILAAYRRRLEQGLRLSRNTWCCSAVDGSSVPTRPALPKSLPLPCWEVTLTPLGVETLRDLVPRPPEPRRATSVCPPRRRALVSITGISKEGNVADVDFRWKWMPLNEVGSALYTGGVRIRCQVGFKHYDDGWRLVGGHRSPKDWKIR